MSKMAPGASAPTRYIYLSRLELTNLYDRSII